MTFVEAALWASRTPRVAEAVGDLPLAVDQAGSLLASTSMDVGTYLQLLAERAEDAFDYDPAGAYPVSVIASWAVAFDRLDTDVPGRAATAHPAGLART